MRWFLLGVVVGAWWHVRWTPEDEPESEISFTMHPCAFESRPHTSCVETECAWRLSVPQDNEK